MKWSIIFLIGLVNVCIFSFYCSNFGEVQDVAKIIGLGDHIEIKLSWLDTQTADATKGTQSYAIDTDLEAELELPSVWSGHDILQGIYDSEQR